MFFQGSKRTLGAFFSIVTTLLRLQFGHHLKRKLIWFFFSKLAKTSTNIFFCCDKCCRLVWYVAEGRLNERKFWARTLAQKILYSLLPALEWATEPRHSNDSVFSAVFHWVKTLSAQQGFIYISTWMCILWGSILPTTFCYRRNITNWTILGWNPPDLLRTPVLSLLRQDLSVIKVELVVHLGSTW